MKPEDTVIHLGDVAWGEESLKRFADLPGHRILVKGNHDAMPDAAYMEAGFVPVCAELLITFDGMRVLFTHRPKFGHTADINIHGHFHDLHREDFSRLYLPMALERMGYRPVAVNHDFLGRLHSWVNRKHIPTLEEIMRFGKIIWVSRRNPTATEGRRRKITSALSNDGVVSRLY